MMRDVRPKRTVGIEKTLFAAGYYSYLWSEVLGADDFDAFTETGDIFNPDIVRRLREHSYATGGRR